MIHHKDTKERSDSVSRRIIGAAIEVHKTIGPGLLESAYEECMCHELRLKGISFSRQVPLSVKYKGTTLDLGYRMDLVVDGLVIVELKAVEHIELIHQAQLLTYLRLANAWLGLLINFNVPILKTGIKRLVNG